MTLLPGMRLKAPIRIRLHIVVLLAGVWLAVAGFLAWDYHQELQSGARQSATLSKSLATHAEQVLDDAERLGHIIEETVRTYGINATLHSFLPSQNTEQQLILQLSLVDTSGRLRSSTTPDFQAIDLSDREHIKTHLNNEAQGLFISKPLIGRASGRPSVQLSRAIRDTSGALLGVLVISIDPAQLTERYRKLNIGSNGLIALVGTLDGVVRLVRSTNRIPGIEPGTISPALLNWANLGAAGEKTVTAPPSATADASPPAAQAFQTEALLLSGTKVPRYPLAVVVGLSRDEQLAPYHLRKTVLIGATLILTLFAFIGEFRQARLVRHAEESDYQLSQALRKVLARERRVADLFRAIPDPAIAFARDSHRVTGFNPPMLRLTRMDATTIEGADLDTFTRGVFAADVSPDRDERMAALRGTLEDALRLGPEDDARCFDIQIDTPAPLVYEVRIEPMDDEPSGMLVLLRNITAQHRLERMTNDFAATAAHEMRTPLASILGFSELLAAGLISENERPKIAEQIYRRAKSMSELVNDLLTLTRLETGKGGGQFTAFDLRTIIEPLLRQIPDAAPSLTLDIPPTPVPVMGNVFELVTALRNAVENAFKYGAPEKGIALRLWADNEHGQARLVVADQGPGIADDDIHRVFKRFVRLEAGGNLEGSGLGLPLVRGVLQHHKGWAWAESAPGEGFKLHMALPLYAGLPS
ncbi:MAG: hypothetical protein GX086_14565 [Alcaligenaceae bacterium]|nr:hypothetical protein [Alcaligenaceae bacterium]